MQAERYDYLTRIYAYITNMKKKYFLDKNDLFNNKEVVSV